MNEEKKRTIHPLTIWGPIIVIVCGLVIFWNYMLKLQHDKASPRLPILSRLEKNLVLTERSGRQVELKDVKGKVIIACWVFTRCPRGCAGVVGELLGLYKEIGNEEGIQFISFSVDPDDSPEQLRKFAENLNIKGDNWWFVNGVKDEVRTYMTHYFGFMDVQDVPEKDRLSPDDKFLHDMKVGLVDHQGHVRGFYDIASYDPEYKEFWKEKIRKDIKTLLKDRDEAMRLEKANP